MIGKMNTYVISTCRYAGSHSPGNAHDHSESTDSHAAVAAFMHHAQPTTLHIDDALLILLRFLLLDEWLWIERRKVEKIQKYMAVRLAPAAFLGDLC